MKKIKVLKHLPKGKENKTTYNKTRKYKYSNKDKTNEKYLEYYDDIKISSKKFDW